MSANDPQGGGAEGFTLLEAIVAFTLVATVMVGVGELFARDLNGVGAADDYARAVAFAESRLEGMGITEPLVLGTSQGRFDDRFSWQADVAPAQGVRPEGYARDAAHLQRLRVTVSWGTGEASVPSLSMDFDWSKIIEQNSFHSGGRGEGGFSLVEIVVSVALLGLLCLLLFGSLGFGVRVMDTVSRRTDVASQLSTVQDFLHNQLTQAQPMIADGKGDGRALMFDGRSQGVDFVALAPAYLPIGGYQVLSLRVDTTGDRKRLVALWRPFIRWAVDPTAATADRQSLLLDELASVEFSYYGSAQPKAAPSWQSDWHLKTVLPSLVRLRVDPGRGRPIQEFVVTPRLAENLS